ncbi:MAG: putative sulfate exporter family transporter [Thermaerobacterales bacterium]
MIVSFPVAHWLGTQVLIMQGIDPAQASGPVSGVLVAIVLGLLLGNTLSLPAAVQPVIRFAVTTLLRLGIVLVGIKLSLLDIVRLGAWGIPIVAGSIGAGLILVTWMNRLLGLPPRLGTLIAAGTGICGVTAIVSVAPVIKAEQKEVAYAIANITLFGLVGMFVYPYVAAALPLTSEQVGLFLGIAIHETAQVVGAGLTYREVFHDDTAFQVATVAKLTRNLFLAVVIPLLAFLHFRDQSERDGGAGLGFSSVVRFLPIFVLGFIAMAVVRTIGDATLGGGLAFGLWDRNAWTTVVAVVGDRWGSKYLLGTAMAGVGLGTSFSVFKGVGVKPFAVGLFGALLVGVVGLVLVLILGRYVIL